MLKGLKRFWHLMCTVSTTRLERQMRTLSIFDLVSRVPNPAPNDLYMVYSFSDKEVFLVKWVAYNLGGAFDADIDKQFVYTYWQARDSLYKVSNFSIQPHTILMNASIRELQTYSMRLNHVYGANLPLMGVFIDHRDQHLMLVAHVTGSVESGNAIVYDLTVAPTAGILHSHQVSHVVKIRDIINNHTLRAIDTEDLVTLLRQPWRKEVLKDLTVKMFDAIRTTEVKGDKYAISCLGLTKAHSPEEPNPIQLKTPNKENKK